MKFENPRKERTAVLKRIARGAKKRIGQNKNTKLIKHPTKPNTWIEVEIKEV